MLVHDPTGDCESKVQRFQGEKFSDVGLSPGGEGGRIWGSWQRLMFEMASGHLALPLDRHNQLLLHVRFFGEKLSCVNWLCFILSISI